MSTRKALLSLSWLGEEPFRDDLLVSSSIQLYIVMVILLKFNCSNRSLGSVTKSLFSSEINSDKKDCTTLNSSKCKIVTDHPSALSQLINSQNTHKVTIQLVNEISTIIVIVIVITNVPSRQHSFMPSLHLRNI